MNIIATGIIAEYNPFHNGHKYMLQQARQLTDNAPVIVCISGSITQRGEIAILDKWQRARAAVENGADLVIELPAIYACRSGEAFATGGVRLLAATGVVATLAFGTEYPHIDTLLQAAALRPEDHPQRLQELLKAGHSYGSALSQLIAEELSLPEAMLREPNTILALEYLRATNKLQQEQGPAISPLPIRRQGAGHITSAIDRSFDAGFASGSAIRKAAMSWQNDTQIDKLRKLVPEATWQALASAQIYPSMEGLLPLIRWQLLTATPQELRQLQGIGEGLEHRLLQSLDCHSYSELVNRLATRRYPATRIQRLLIHLLLRLGKAQVLAADASGPLYIRVLAFNATGRHLLKEIKQQGCLPIITKTADYISCRQLESRASLSPLQEMLYIDILATNLRAMTLPSSAIYQDLRQSPIFM